MKRPITDQERSWAEIQIGMLMGMVRMGLVTSMRARVLDETNDDGEVGIECDYELLPQIESVTFGNKKAPGVSPEGLK